MDITEMELERVKGLAHGNIHVRSEILSTFSRDSPIWEEATGIAISQVERYGWENSYIHAHVITRLPHTLESFEWALDSVFSGKLRRKSHDYMPPELHLLGWIENAPLEWLRPRLEEIRSHLAGLPKVDKVTMLSGSCEEFLRVAESRIAANAVGGDELRREITAAVEACAADEEFPRKQIMGLEAFCEAAVAKGIFTDEDLAGWLDAPFAGDVDDLDSVPGYFAGAALLVLSERRLPVPPEMTARIVRLFDMDWDWTNELIAKTLERTADREMLADLIRMYPTLEWHARLFLSGVFESVRISGFEADFQELYLNEEDLMMKTTLAKALALHGTETAIHTARQHLREYGEFNESESLRDLVFCQEIVLGQESPAASAHLLRMKSDRKRIDKGFAQMSALLNAPNPAPSLLGKPKEKKERTPSAWLPARLPALAGRNEPCPCGSGMKYKKCCGKV